MAKDLRPVHTAANEAAALARFQEFDDQWGQRYPAITRVWRSAWTEFVPFLDYDVEVDASSPATNAIETSTPDTAGRYEPEDTSRPSRPR